MPRYYLHMRCQGEVIRDEEGFDLPDLAAALQEALRGARSIMAAEVQQGRLKLDQAIEIYDAEDRLAATLDFCDAVEIAGYSEGKPAEAEARA